MKHVSNRESHREKLHKQITEFLFLDASLNIKRNLLSVLMWYNADSSKEHYMQIRNTSVHFFQICALYRTCVWWCTFILSQGWENWDPIL